MKKNLSMIIVMLCIAMTTTARDLSADAVLTAATTSANVAGEYDGKFTSIYMNGDKDVPTDTYTAEVESNTDGTININVEVPKIGSMPGTITIDAQNITLNSDGTFSQTVNDAIKLKIVFTHGYKAIVSGSFNNGVLTLSVESVDASYAGVSFTAKVGFTGTKVD